MAQSKIMIVDDDQEIIQLLKFNLSNEGYAVIYTTDGNRALDLISTESPDLILLDVVMPDINGIDLCAQIRENYSTPVIFLSCKNRTSDKILGLSIGGDDYITKPFVCSEMLARIKANLRRSYTQKIDSGGNAAKIISFDELKIDLTAHTASINMADLNLTAKEFALLSLLALSPNRVFTAKQIFEHLWQNYGVEEDCRTVMVHMSNLRKKLGSYPGYSDRIKTVRGVGYKFVN